MKPQTKKGQVLILALIVMAIGLIVLTPLLHFLNGSYNIYSYELTDTRAYYAADAVMENVISDLYAGTDVVNQSAIYNTNLPDGWINGYNVNTTITNSVINTLSTKESEDDLYLDPGVAQGLGSLAYGATHDFKVYLTEGSNVTAHWYFDDKKDDPYMGHTCDYHCIGEMWITDNNGTQVYYSNSSPVKIGPLENAPSVAFSQSLRWTVPVNGSGDYIIKFRQTSYRKIFGCYTGSACGDGGADKHPDLSFTNCDATETREVWNDWLFQCYRTIRKYACASPFSDVGEADHTWVQISNWAYACGEGNTVFITAGTKDVRYGANGKYFYKYNQTSNLDCNNDTFGDPISGVAKHCDCKDAGTTTTSQIQVYTITTTAKNLKGQNVLSITTSVRLTPGLLQWWKDQAVEVVSRQVTEY